MVVLILVNPNLGTKNQNLLGTTVKVNMNGDSKQNLTIGYIENLSHGLVVEDSLKIYLVGRFRS
eukprot:CAMPEP_0194229410 /NCGR_PEP_ID=MMETSP0156-20130528/43878_1 /TAXON_ID=33649 /ORGANISM="Thalassionema nitzschioides, Strain L26-B" /LENGTH=63 /DNA_ID=CAMNT_0038961959 /DNA_START=685 /DNA_END=873 /DNA_ORIENTATION=-